MRVSVVTPVYNDPRVSRAVASIFAQEGDFEVESLVVDGASGDPLTRAALDEARALGARVISEPDRGIYDAMNKGVLAATGDVVAILNADDTYAAPDVLAQVVRRFETTSTEICFGDLAYVDDSGRPVRSWKGGRSRRWKWYLGWMPAHPTFFVRREVYERHGLFDLSFRIAADCDLMLRFVLVHRVPTEYIPIRMVNMALGGNSNRSVGAIVRANAEMWRSWRKYMAFPPPWVVITKPAQKLSQYVRALGERWSSRSG